VCLVCSKIGGTYICLVYCVTRLGRGSNILGIFRRTDTQKGMCSLGVNRMWTKRNDHATKIECVDFCNIFLKKGNFERNSSLTILSSSLVFIFSSPPPKNKNKNHYDFIITTFFYHGPLPFSTRAPLLLFPSQNPLNHVSG